MSELNKLLWKQLRNELEQVESVPDVRSRLLSQVRSKYPPRILGTTSEGPLILTEEQRESHIHILGAPGQGKSKLLEMLIRQDLKRGYGACLLDPSDNGDTMYKVLRWCIKTGFEKVCIIDPHDRKMFVPAISPRHNLMETVRILFGTKDFSETPVIEKFLPATLYALRKSKKTLAELVYFTDPKNTMYKFRRNEILDELHPLDRHRVDLESVFAQPPTLFNNSYGSTIRRFEPFLEGTMTLMFGAKEGIPFYKMITDGWLILCNLDYQGVSPDFDNRHQRLIGTAVINEIFYAISTLRSKGWKGIYYLYIDEVGDYATRNLSTILDKKRKSGLRLTVAHQRFAQLEDQYVRDSILTGTGIKVLFQTANPEDRLKMIKMMYGGGLSDREVSFVTGQLAKQHASIKIEKGEALVTKLKKVPDVPISREDVEAFKKKIYNRDSWYHTPEAVLKEINDRFTKAEPAITISKRRTSKRPLENASKQPRKRQDNRSSTARAVPVDKPDSHAPLLSKKRRPAGKDSDSLPET